MRPDRRVNLLYLMFAAAAALLATWLGCTLISALASGQIEGRSGRVYHAATESGGFGMVFGILLIAFVGCVAAAVYVLWVRPQAVRGEVALTRRLVVRTDLDTAARATLDPTRQSTDG